MANLGTDTGAFDALGSLISQEELLAYDLGWRFQTPEGSLFTDRAYGYDLHQFLGDTIEPERLPPISQRCKVEALKDKRVRKAVADVTLEDIDATKRRVRLLLTGESAAGPFKFVLGVASDKFTLEILTP